MRDQTHILLILGGLLLGAGSQRGHSQGCCGGITPPAGATNLAVIQTGGFEPLVGRSWTLTYNTNLSLHFLHFDFGFATQETPDPDAMLDAISVNIVEPGANLVAVILTGDAGGVAWAPPTAGTVSLSPVLILRDPLPFPAFEPVLPSQAAFRVRSVLPDLFTSGTVRFDFQIFDYPNGLNSFAWCDTPYIVSVPEPAAWSLNLLGFLILVVARFKRA